MSAYNYAYSTDGVNWQPWALYVNGVLTNVAFGNGIFVATYQNGSIDGGSATSSDGRTWTINHNGLVLTKPLWVAAFSKWVATASGGGGYYSTNGLNWTASTLGGTYSGWWPIQAYGFSEVATATHNTSAIGYTPDWAHSSDGINWTTVASVIDGVVVNGTTNLVSMTLNESSGSSYSTDGSTWTSHGVTPGGTASKGYGTAAGTFAGYAFGTGFGFNIPSGYAFDYQGSGDVVYTTDGITWYQSTTPYGATSGANPSFYFLDYAVNGSTEMMMVTAQANAATVTTNLSSWSTVALPALVTPSTNSGGIGYQGIAYNSTLGMWLAVCNNPISSGIVMWI